MTRKSFLFRESVLKSQYVACLFAMVSAMALGYQPIRPGQPVVIEGSALSALAGTTIADLHLRSWDGDQWRAIPFQIDERDVNGSFFDPDDDLLDANDVLTFQPQDAGLQAALTQWIDDDQARLNSRIAIEIADPVEGGSTFAYLYASNTLAPGGAPDLIQYDDVADTITGANYRFGFDASGSIQSDFHFIDGKTLGPDLLDREKLRISGVAIILPFSFNEDDLTITDVQVIDGPVRVLRRVDAEITVQTVTLPLTLDRFYYRSYFTIPPAMGSVTLPDGVSLSAIRFSRDLNPMASGGTVRDPNNGALSVDGVADAGVQTTIAAMQQQAYWTEFQLGDFSLWNAMEIDGLAASTDFYYHDSQGGGTADGTGDSGDGMSFGDHGVLFTNPSSDAIQFSFANFVDEGGNLTGPRLTSYLQQPLQTQTESSDFDSAYWDFIALWGSDSNEAPDVAFLIDFINTFGVQPL